MASGKRTPEYRKIQDNYAKICSTLTDHVSPGDLGNKLFSAKLIGKELKRAAARAIVDEEERINKLLAAVHNQIELKSANFYKFIEILEDYTELEELLKELRCKQISRFVLGNPSSPIIMNVPWPFSTAVAVPALSCGYPIFVIAGLTWEKALKYFSQSRSMPPAVKAILGGEDVLELVISPCFSI